MEMAWANRTRVSTGSLGTHNNTTNTRRSQSQPGPRSCLVALRPTTFETVFLYTNQPHYMITDPTIIISL
jgi:hypothetical protein